MEPGDACNDYNSINYRTYFNLSQKTVAKLLLSKNHIKMHIENSVIIAHTVYFKFLPHWNWYEYLINSRKILLNRCWLAHGLCRSKCATDSSHSTCSQQQLLSSISLPSLSTGESEFALSPLYILMNIVHQENLLHWVTVHFPN